MMQQRSCAGVGELRSDLRQLLRGDDPEYVHFVEFRGKGVFLRACPIDVSAIVREHLLDRMRTTVLTSATLTVDDSFDYLRTRLGIGRASEVRLASEFDFSQQAILYLPKRMPDPRSEDFALAAGREIVESSNGRKAAPSCCSRATRRSDRSRRSPRWRSITQCWFRARRHAHNCCANSGKHEHAVLFATASFGRASNVVGEALSCVISRQVALRFAADR
jgi:ATP-dependent DNA helicase DinG